VGGSVVAGTGGGLGDDGAAFGWFVEVGDGAGDEDWSSGWGLWEVGGEGVEDWAGNCGIGRGCRIELRSKTPAGRRATLGACYWEPCSAVCGGGRAVLA